MRDSLSPGAARGTARPPTNRRTGREQTPAERLRLAVIVASTREGRLGGTVGAWFTDQALARDDLELDVIDLRETPLPAVQQTHPVASGEYRSPRVRAFAARIGRADGFVVVTPEYNHGYPATLKLAIDSVSLEWHRKPVGFVSYGGVAGGLRAVEQLRQVFAELRMVTVRDTVSFHGARRQFDRLGRLQNPEAANAAAAILLDQLTWWARALREHRLQA